jgi:hypothetical protein
MLENEDRSEKVEEKVCPVCGHCEDIKEINVDEEEVKEFIRSLLGNRPFFKEYKLYNDQFKIKFKTLNTEDSERLTIFLTKLRNEDININELKQKSLSLKLLYYTDEVNGKKINFKGYTDIEDAFNSYKDNFKDLGENVIGLCIRTLVQFLFLQKLLIDKGYDENFWRSAGLH